MIAEETWRRYTARWGALALGGLFAMLVSLVVGLIGSLAVGAAMVSGGLNFLMLAGGDPNALVRVLAGLGVALLIVLVAAVVVAPIGFGGLTYAVVQVQRDAPVTFGDIWQAGLRYWGRLLGLNLIFAVVGILMLLLLWVLRWIPVLGPLAWFFGFALVALVMGGYGPYLVVSEELSATQAAGRAFRILTSKFVDVLLTFLVLVGAGLVVGLVTGILSMIPGVGLLVTYASQVFLTPLALLYLAVRYQRNIAPDLGPPGGRGRFDPGPPPGP